MVIGLASAGALLLSIYNTVELKRKPGRERQQQLWDDLRAVLQPLPPLLQSAASNISCEQDVAQIPTELADAPRRLHEMAWRFRVAEDSTLLNALGFKLEAVLVVWGRCLYEQSAVDQDAESTTATRRRDAAHRRLVQQVQEARPHLDGWIARLDRRDRLG